MAKAWCSHSALLVHRPKALEMLNHTEMDMKIPRHVALYVKQTDSKFGLGLGITHLWLAAVAFNFTYLLQLRM